MNVTRLFGLDVDLDVSEIVWLRNEVSYAVFVGVLSNIYMKAHACSQIRTRPYSAAIVVNEQMVVPHHGQPESPVERLWAIASNMVAPDNGIDLGIFSCDGMGRFAPTGPGWKYTSSQCWPLQNSVERKEMVTLHLPGVGMQYNTSRYFSEKSLPSLQCLTPTTVNHHTPIAKLLELFRHTRLHVCYQGGTSWLSLAMNIPTIIVHPVSSITDSYDLKPQIYGQSVGEINVRLDDGTVGVALGHPHEHNVTLSEFPTALLELIE